MREISTVPLLEVISNHDMKQTMLAMRTRTTKSSSLIRSWHKTHDLKQTMFMIRTKVGACPPATCSHCTKPMEVTSATAGILPYMRPRA